MVNKGKNIMENNEFCPILTVNLLFSLKPNPSFSKATMYVASKQRYGEDIDSLEHATEKHKGLNMRCKTVLCKCAKYALCS